MDFPQSWPKPKTKLPIVVIGAGGIVVDSHMPAYRQAGYEVAGIWNRSVDRAERVASKFGIPRVYSNLEEATNQQGVIFDVATSPQVHSEILRKLPAGAPVLIQKPLGLDLAAATEILSICRAKKFKAAVNFQLRFAPMMLAIKNAIDDGFFGELTEFEVHLNLVTPWHMFPNLEGDPRVEIVAHSVHYIDLIQSLIGMPNGVVARSFSHPASNLSDTRSSMIFDYGQDLRVVLSINHHHDFGRSHQDSTIRFEGDKGAAVVKLGVLLDYPRGEPDELWMGKVGEQLQKVVLKGSWFPDAFEQIMHNMQGVATGEETVLKTSVESAWKTMSIVEACYDSVKLPLQPITELPLEN